MVVNWGILEGSMWWRGVGESAGRNLLGGFYEEVLS